MRLIAPALVALIVLVVAAGCVETNRPNDDACAAPAVAIDLSLADDRLTPNDPAVCRGQQVTLRIESSTDGVLHIHGYDEEVPATSVEPGQTLELPFEASRTGQFPIELHTPDAPDGMALGILTVHEP